MAMYLLAVFVDRVVFAVVVIGGKLCPRQSLRAGIYAAVCARSREGEWYPLTLILPPLTSILLYRETACNLQSNTPLQ